MLICEGSEGFTALQRRNSGIWSGFAIIITWNKPLKKREKPYITVSQTRPWLSFFRLEKISCRLVLMVDSVDPTHRAGWVTCVARGLLRTSISPCSWKTKGPYISPGQKPLMKHAEPMNDDTCIMYLRLFSKDFFGGSGSWFPFLLGRLHANGTKHGGFKRPVVHTEIIYTYPIDSYRIYVWNIYLHFA